MTDVEKDRLLWEDLFDIPPANMIAMQAQIAAKTRRSLAPLLGAPGSKRWTISIPASRRRRTG
ncbi:MAG: hypothetical protein ABSH52_31805 [Terriglobia bacterium]|jgi:hypothetical protein